MPASTHLTEPEMTAWRSFLVASTRLVERLDRELRDAHGLSLAEYEVLLFCSQAPGRRLRMSELADRVLVTRSRLTHTVDRLERQGLVARQQVPEDRRGMYAVLTRRGVAMLRRAAPTHVAGIRRYFLEPLAATDLAALGGVAATVTGALDGG